MLLLSLLLILELTPATSYTLPKKYEKVNYEKVNNVFILPVLSILTEARK